MSKQTKQLQNVPTRDSISEAMEDGSYIPLVTDDGEVAKLPLQDLLNGFDSNHAMYDGVGVAYIDKTYHALLSCPLSEWSSRYAAGERAEGVLVETPVKTFIVAAKTATRPWATGAVQVGEFASPSGPNFKNLDTPNTNAAVTHAECAGTTSAHSYCKAYRSDNPRDHLTTWHLPTPAELCLIHANMGKINAALAAISGQRIATNAGHWSCGEYTDDRKMCVYMGDLRRGHADYASNFYVRPVAEYTA